MKRLKRGRDWAGSRFRRLKCVFFRTLSHSIFRGAAAVPTPSRIHLCHWRTAFFEFRRLVWNLNSFTSLFCFVLFNSPKFSLVLFAFCSWGFCFHISESAFLLWNGHVSFVTDCVCAFRNFSTTTQQKLCSPQTSDHPTFYILEISF